MDDTECKQIVLRKVIFYLKDSEMSNPGNLYPVMELETMYSNLLKYDNIHHNNHSTTFADLLVKNVPGLKELRNCISRITCVWSLFCSIRVYKSLRFLPILLKK